jgi:NNP family nitrate/nitrite transporter-like MFS transporter
MIGGLGGFVLPIAFGALNDWLGVWTSCFMLLFVLVGIALSWMHFAILRMERRHFPQIKGETDLPELITAAQEGAGQKGAEPLVAASRGVEAVVTRPVATSS